MSSDRGSNERSVNMIKRAGHVSIGFVSNMDPFRMNKAWRAWVFQSNFMFKSMI